VEALSAKKNVEEGVELNGFLLGSRNLFAGILEKYIDF